MIGSPWHFNALAQEFTRKYWINGHVFGSEDIDFEANAHESELLSRDQETNKLEPVGVNVRELIRASHREPLSGIPYHKAIPARVEKFSAEIG